jgi:hypothetical protein
VVVAVRAAGASAGKAAERHDHDARTRGAAIIGNAHGVRCANDFQPRDDDVLFGDGLVLLAVIVATSREAIERDRRSPRGR